jgi:hypothetical protein
MSAGELKESEPVGIQLAPAGTDAPAVGKPAEGALNYPTTSRVLGFTWDRALIRLRFTAPAAVFDVRNIVFQFKKVPYIGVIHHLFTALGNWGVAICLVIAGLTEN